MLNKIIHSIATCNQITKDFIPARGNSCSFRRYHISADLIIDRWLDCAKITYKNIKLPVIMGGDSYLIDNAIDSRLQEFVNNALQELQS